MRIGGPKLEGQQRLRVGTARMPLCGRCTRRPLSLAPPHPTPPLTLTLTLTLILTLNLPKTLNLTLNPSTLHLSAAQFLPVPRVGLEPEVDAVEGLQDPATVSLDAGDDGIRERRQVSRGRQVVVDSGEQLDRRPGTH